MSKYRGLLVLGIVVLAIALRWWFVGGHVFYFDDSKDYLALAQSIVEGRDYQVRGLYAQRMPGYPVLLAGIMQVKSGTEWILRSQALMGGLCCGLVYLLGRRLGVGQRGVWIGLVAAGLLAVDPLQVGFAGAVLSEIPYTLLLLVGLWVAGRLVPEPGRFLGDQYHWRWWNFINGGGGGGGWWMVLGVVWGVGIYVRGSGYMLLLPLGIFLVGYQVVVARAVARVEGVEGLWKTVVIRGLGGVMLAWLMCQLVLVPWNMRNNRLFGPEHGLTSLEGISLYESVYPEADGGPRQDKIVTPPEIAGLDEMARNAAWISRARGYLWGEPGRMLKLAGVKLLRTWSPTFHAAEFQESRMQLGLKVWSLGTYALALLGVWVCWQERGLRGWMGLLLMPVIYFSLLHAVFLGSVRYRVPVLPVVDLFAAAGVVWLVNWGGAKIYRRRHLSGPRSGL